MTGKRKIMVLLPFALGMGFVGVFLAAFLARVSSKVLDREEAEEILQQPRIESIAKSLIADNSRASLHEDRVAVAEVGRFINRLCTRIELCERKGATIRILVASTYERSPSAQVAALIAREFSQWGLDVVFADAVDGINQPSELQQAAELGSVADFQDDAAQASSRWEVAIPRQTTSAAPLVAVSMSAEADIKAMHRAGADGTVNALSRECDALVIATGSLLQARTAAQLVGSVDVVVLLLSLKRQSRSELLAIAHQMSTSNAALIVLEDPTKPHTRSRRVRRPRRVKSGRKELAKPRRRRGRSGSQGTQAQPSIDSLAPRS